MFKDCPTFDSKSVVLVENEPESVLRFVTLVLNEPLSDFKLLTLVENEPESVFRFVILVENEALGAENEPDTVSYTHLTLPTSDLV